MDTNFSIRPTKVVDDVDFYSIPEVIGLSFYLSDCARDWWIFSESENKDIPIGFAVLSVINGEGEDVRFSSKDYKKFLKKHSSFIQAASLDTEIGDFRMGHGEKLRDFDSIGKDSIKNFVNSKFNVIKQLYLASVSRDEPLGQIKGKLNGVDLTYYDTKIVEFEGRGGYTDGFYLHNFFDSEGHIVTWRTGKRGDFQRDGLYTIIGGSIKDHSKYRNEPLKTIITRAKFFDHQTNEIYISNYDKEKLMNDS